VTEVMTVELMRRDHQDPFVQLLSVVMFAHRCKHSWGEEHAEFVSVEADRVGLTWEVISSEEVAPGQHTLLVVAVQSIVGLFEDLEKVVLVPELALVDGQLEPESYTVVSIRH